MFGNDIAELRKEKGLSQKHLAELLSISTSTLGMWELSKRESSFDNLIAIADYFEVSIDYIIRGNGNAPNNHAQLTPEEHELLMMFNRLSRRNQFEAIGMMKAVFLMDNSLYQIDSDKFREITTNEKNKRR